MKCKLCNFKLLEALFLDSRLFFCLKLMRGTTNFHLRPFSLNCYQSEFPEAKEWWSKLGCIKAKSRLEMFRGFALHVKSIFWSKLLKGGHWKIMFKATFIAVELFSGCPSNNIVDSISSQALIYIIYWPLFSNKAIQNYPRTITV